MAGTREIQGKDAFVALFERSHGERGNGADPLGPVRQAAVEQFGALGFPTTRDELWRHTSLAPLAAQPFQSAPVRDLDEAQVARLSEFTFADADGTRLVFVNGRYCDRLSSIGGASDGVRAKSLMSVLESDPDQVKASLGQCASFEKDPFIALNTALWRDGAFVVVPPGAAPARPIHILYVTLAEEEPVFTCARTLILAGTGSHATVLESHVGFGGVYFSNAVSEITLGEDTVMDHYTLEEESEQAFAVSTVSVRQERSSNFTNHAVLVGGRIARNNIGVVLDGEGAECALNGAYLGRGTQHMDTHTRIEHVKPRGRSRETYKGILDDTASGVFNGRIHVHPDAQKTDAIQSNRALLLSDRATVHTQPQLMIFADDVRCTHGATVGRIDEEAVFYLRSRGISADDARGLLNYAFVNEVIDEIKVAPVRRRLERLVAARFRKERLLTGDLVS